jgi:ATP-dependent Lon protease
VRVPFSLQRSPSVWLIFPRAKGYTHDEKTHIARRFLIPKQLHANALTSEHVAIADEALARVVGEYTREAGVRSLERVVGAVVRYKAVEWAERREAGDNTQGAEDDGAAEDGYVPVVEAPDLERILGVARFDREERERGEEPRRGVVYGLVVSGDVGEGGVVAVESLIVPGGSGRLKLTGSLGEVIKESGELALSWVKRHAYELCVTDRRGQDPLRMPPDDLAVDVHLHLPAGAQRKDGPSAGIAMVRALQRLDDDDDG